jgi:hypothetical protein
MALPAQVETQADEPAVRERADGSAAGRQTASSIRLPN